MLLNPVKLAFTKEEIKRNKSILLATLNYLLEYHSEDLVLDGYSPSRQWYLSEISQTGLDIGKSRSQRIKRRLEMHLSLLRYRFDLGLNAYIRAHTGYELDLFSEYKVEVMPIIARGSITGNDVYLIENYLKAYGTDPLEKRSVAFLEKLTASYKAKIQRLGAIEIVVTVTSDPLSQRKWLLYEETAPNGIFNLSVRISGKGAQAQTYVHIALPGGEAGIYGAMGEQLPIKAHWKNDHCIVIDTKENYKTAFKYSRVDSYANGVSIEYRFI